MLFNLFNRKPKNYIDLNAAAFKEGIKSKDAVLIDVRSAGEFSGSKIKGARNMDVQSLSFTNQIKNLPKDKAYYLYCRSGNRSGHAASIMAGNGFEQVYNLVGGIGRWPYQTI